MTTKVCIRFTEWNVLLRLFILLTTAVLLPLGVSAEQLNNIEYLCADWGPAMKLPVKKGEEPQFSDTEEEIYFLKQVTSLKRINWPVADPLTGNKSIDTFSGRSICLCKMKPDGSDKTEIRELWHNPAYPIDTQSESTWMSVNAKTHKIALSITFAGTDTIGLWTVNLDGTTLQRVIGSTQIEGRIRGVDSPSWTPDGQWIVFVDSLRGSKLLRIAKCDKNGSNLVYLTEGPSDYQSRVSPDGTKILFVRNPMIKLEGGLGDRWVAATVWLMDLDGSNKREIPNPEAKSSWATKGIWGTHPTWSPDGKRILLTSMGLIDVATGKKIHYRVPLLNGKQFTWGWAHWGSLGIIGYNLTGILFTDNDIKEAKLLGCSQMIECNKGSASCKW